MRLLLILVGLGLTGCVTPDSWKPEQHQKQMMFCRQMCGEGLVVKYTPYTGECSCRKAESP